MWVATRKWTTAAVGLLSLPSWGGLSLPGSSRLPLLVVGTQAICCFKYRVSMSRFCQVSSVLLESGKLPMLYIRAADDKLAGRTVERRLFARRIAQGGEEGRVRVRVG